MYRHRDDFGADVGGSLVGIALVLALLGAFLTVVTIIFVVKCFVTYPHKRKTLWMALAVCLALCLIAGLVYKLTGFDGASGFACIGVAEFLITCLVVDLQNRDTLLRENVSLVDSVLHSSWWGSEDTPRQEQIREQIVA